MRRCVRASSRTGYLYGAGRPRRRDGSGSSRPDPSPRRCRSPGRSDADPSLIWRAHARTAPLTSARSPHAAATATRSRSSRSTTGAGDPRLAAKVLGSPYGIRTRAATLRGWCPRPLDERAKLRHATSGDWRPRVSWGARTRTLNNRTRICCVTYYTTPHGAPRFYRAPERGRRVGWSFGSPESARIGRNPVTKTEPARSGRSRRGGRRPRRRPPGGGGRTTRRR